MVAVPAIESASNPLIREIARSLDEHTHLLLEGEKTILDAVAAGITLDYVLHDASVRPGRLAALTSAHPSLVSRAVLERLADSKTPQHLLAIARRRDVPVAAILERTGPVVFVFGIQDPGNLGAIVRVAEAGGASSVLAAGKSADPFGWKALRGSMGSALRLPVDRVDDAESAVAEARARGCYIVATVPRDGRSHYDARLTGKLAVLIGGEGPGLPEKLIAAADERVTIPMEDGVESLNAATTAAVIVYEARRQRQTRSS
jgi:TrmH family RNA methyltransferase